MATTDEIITKDQLREWLSKQEGDVGIARTSESCPCSNCIREINGLPGAAVVNVYTEETYVNHIHYRNAPWLQTLVTAIDVEHGHQQPVSAQQVVEYLDRQS